MSNSINDELIEDEQDSPDVEVQKAYDASRSVNWTISRQSVAMTLGCSILSGVFGPELKGLQTKGVYPSALQDVIVVLWLLSLTPDEVIEQLSYPNRKKALADAYAFAETEGLRYGSPRYLEGVKTLTEIVGSVFTSFYGVSSNGSKDPQPKNDTRRPGKSGRHIQQSKRAATTPTTSKT